MKEKRAATAKSKMPPRAPRKAKLSGRKLPYRKAALTRVPEQAPARPADKARVAGARAAAIAAIDAALDKQALLPVVIDVSEQASYTDFIAVISGRSDRQVNAIAERVRDAMRERGLSLLGREGTGNGRWTLLDFGALVVHIFYHPVREFYDIESLWGDAPRLPLRIPPEARLQTPDALYDVL